jgi:hypothetical protein
MPAAERSNSMRHIAAGPSCAGARRWAGVAIELGENVKTELMLGDNHTKSIPFESLFDELSSDIQLASTRTQVWNMGCCRNRSGTGRGWHRQHISD